MNAIRRAGRGTKAAKQSRLSGIKQRAVLQQLEPVRGIEKIVIKPTGQKVYYISMPVNAVVKLYLCEASFH